MWRVWLMNSLKIVLKVQGNREVGEESSVVAAQGRSPDLQTLFRRFWKVAAPYWNSDDKVQARLQLAGVFSLTLVTTGISVGFNFLGRDFFNALASKVMSICGRSWFCLSSIYHLSGHIMFACIWIWDFVLLFTLVCSGNKKLNCFKFINARQGSRAIHEATTVLLGWLCWRNPGEHIAALS